jgi:hypothetical protein
MDPNQTAPQQSYNPAKPTNLQPLDTVQLPKPPNEGSVINSDKYFTWSKVREDFRRPVKRVGLTVISLLAIITLLSVLINGLKSLFTHTPPTPSTFQPTSSPIQAPTVSSTAITNTALAIKCGTGKVPGIKVDTIFYQQHPELKGRRLTNSEADKSLRVKWCEIADRLSN